MLRLMDDIVLVAESEEDLQMILKIMVEVMEKNCNMKMNNKDNNLSIQQE